MKQPRPRAVADLLLAAVPALRDRMVEERIRRAWPELVGGDVARRARPEKLVDGCLHVAVDNSPWLHELTLRSADIQARLTAAVGEVRTVRFALGRLPADPAATPRAARPRPRPLGSEDLREIDAAVAEIPDSALRAAARQLLVTARQYPIAPGGE